MTFLKNKVAPDPVPPANPELKRRLTLGKVKNSSEAESQPKIQKLSALQSTINTQYLTRVSFICKQKYGTFKCLVCLKIVSSIESARNHLWTHSSNVKFTCCLCKFKSNLEDSIINHYKVEHGRSMSHKMLLSIAGGRFPTPNIEFSKSIAILDDLPQKTNTLKCPWCPNCSFPEESIICHFRAKHSKKPLFCPTCFIEFTSSEGLFEHVKLHPDNWACPVCKVELVSRVVLDQHMNMKHGSNASRCPVCFFDYVNSKDLRQHFKTAHPANKTVKFCALCHKLYCNQQLLDAHHKKSICGRTLRYQAVYDQTKEIKTEEEVEEVSEEVMFFEIREVGTDDLLDIKKEELTL